MGFAERVADETAHHYAELRNRRIPWVPAVLMALSFHYILSRAVLFDEQFEQVVKRILREQANAEVQPDA